MRPLIINQLFTIMKAIATFRNHPNGQYYEIKIANKAVCYLYSSFHSCPNSYTISFCGIRVLRNIPYEEAFTKVFDGLHDIYGVTEITDELNYPWHLLEIFQDPLLADVRPC